MQKLMENVSSIKAFFINILAEPHFCKSDAK